jgi:hypothetical protein
MDREKAAPLVFVYNADSGLFNALTDLAHKTFAPQTYQCHLCALTYSTLGMRRSWKQFLETLNRPYEFLHADELKRLYDVSETPLPAVFEREEERLKLLIAAQTINACGTLDDLKELITDRTR